MADRAGPLASLATLLRQGAPPSLDGLHAWFSQGEAYRDFVALVRQYLPQYEVEILAEVGVERRIAAFARHFEDRYFPLPDVFQDVEEYEQLTREVPIIRMGISWDDYHMMPESGWRPGYLLLAVLPENPAGEQDGARTALLEACAEHVPKGLLERMGQGYSREVLHERLDGTRFEAAALMCDWVYQDTGNVFLDSTNEEDVEEPWNPETVRIATRLWGQARDIQDRVHSLAEWVEVEPPARFRELLDFLEGREPPASMTLEEWAVRQREETRKEADNDREQAYARPLAGNCLA